ncbi:MAG: hypothetical protein AMJ79_10260 [Phycisphaerae bacterium SM23_30]|nr:MAG: hypothetical protein AMJ79_10260 [Phycisphaerae bacterium SM23_30]
MGKHHYLIRYWELPEAGDEFVFDFLDVMGISGEFFPEGSVFEGGADEQKDDAEGGGDKGDEGAEDQGQADKQEDAAEVAGVADEAVGAGVDDGLAAVFLDADDTGEESVGAHGPEVEGDGNDI